MKKLNKKNISIVVLLLIISTCAVLDKNRIHSKYYSEDRFHNLDDDSELMDKGLLTVLRWKLFGPSDDHLPGTTDDQIPYVKKIKKSDLYLQKNENIKITWLGHATAFISLRVKGKQKFIITDPVFEGIFTRSRILNLPISKTKLPPIDYALISHNHFDHCDIDSLLFLQKKNPKIVFLFPEAMTSWAKSNKLINVRSMTWWQTLEDASLKIQHLPSQHWSRRTLTDRMQQHWGSYAIKSEHASIYYAGDTAFGSHFEKIKKIYPEGFDFAIMPIGSYAPRWFMKAAHIDPKEAIRASEILGVKKILPVHWGTFNLGDDYPLEPILVFEKILQNKKIKGILWRPGYNDKDKSKFVYRSCDKKDIVNCYNE